MILTGALVGHILIAGSLAAPTAGRATETVEPLPVQACAVDLDGDGVDDVSLVVPTANGFRLVVLLAAGNGYRAVRVTTRLDGRSRLECKRGTSILETPAAGRGRSSQKRRVFKTPGAYVEVRDPEGGSVAYFWSGKEFREVWTAD